MYFPTASWCRSALQFASAEACGFEVRDVESLREHYARTLRHWVQRLEAHYEEARRLTNETIYRVWRIYMAGSARAFARGRINIYQALLQQARGRRDSHLPLTRADWYTIGYGLVAIAGMPKDA